MMKNRGQMKKLSRNDPCWCGSGAKYKSCHLRADRKKSGLFRRLRGGRLTHPTTPGIVIKTEEQVEGIRESCQLVKQTFEMLEGRVIEGAATNDIDRWVHEFTLDHGGFPGTLNYNGYPKSACVSINDVICHGIPDETVLRRGDIVNVDITTVLKGYYGDSSRMYAIGDISPEAAKLIDVSKECLDLGIAQVKQLNTIGDIGHAIQQYAEKRGYSVVRDYAGHGVGLKFHEEPSVNHFGKRKSGSVMVPNMIFTIEPMINIGGYKCKVLDDNWTAVTEDGSLSAQWEHTVRVTENGVEIMTA